MTHINRKIVPLVTAIQNLPYGLKNPINSISELEYLTTAINQTDTLLKENEVFKEQWISGIAHDIKTPLSVIISNASLLNDSELDTQSKKHIRPILTESYYIQNILNDLNIVARLSSGHLQLNQTETKIIPFFKDILIHILNQEIWSDFEFEFDYDYSLVNQTVSNAAPLPAVIVWLAQTLPSCLCTSVTFSEQRPLAISYNNAPVLPHHSLVPCLGLLSL